MTEPMAESMIRTGSNHGSIYGLIMDLIMDLIMNYSMYDVPRVMVCSIISHTDITNNKNKLVITVS